MACRLDVPAQGNSGRYKDELTGQVLKDSFALVARAVEVNLFDNKSV